MKKKDQVGSDYNNGNPGRVRKNVYMIVILALLLMAAIVSFIIDKKMKISDKISGTGEQSTHMELIGDNASDAVSELVWTVYGEMDREALLEQLKATIVRIEAEATDETVTLAGSGVILAVTDTYMDIVTASHVVEQTATPTVQFYGGSSVNGAVLAYGKQSDVAFVRVEMTDLDKDVLARVRTVMCGDNEYYAELQTEEPVYMIGSVSTVAGEIVDGSIKAKEQFVVLFQNDMLLCANPVAAGMSGGGTFCADGSLIGIIVGTDDTDTVNVRITDVMAEYRSISR